LNLARLNHILIPASKSGRDRMRRTLLGKQFELVFTIWNLFSDEGRMLIVLWAIVGAFSPNVGQTQNYLLFSAITGLLLASVILRRGLKLEGVEMDVIVPPRTAVGEEVAFTVELRNSGERDHRALRLEGPFLPWDGKWGKPPSTVSALASGKTVRVGMAARFTRRGEHYLDTFTARALVPLGLTTSPSVRSGGVRFMVVPRVAPISRLLVPTNARYQPGGVALASRTGESMELIGVRPYRPGDPVRDLHARSWARLGQPVVREYQQEYFARVGVVLDTEAGKASEERMEAAISLAAGVVAQLSRGEALIDLLVVGDQVHQLTLGRSLGFLEQALDLLATVEPGPALDAAGLGARLNPYLRRLSGVIFVALDWDESRKQLVRQIRAGGVGCKVLRVGVGGDEEQPGSAEEGDVLSVDQINGEGGLEL